MLEQHLHIYISSSIIYSCLFPRKTTDISLEPDITGMIQSLYEDLEKYHGKMLVGRVLGLLAASTDGMNSDDMLNILSCDEELLHDVLVWHQPPKRRLPPLLVARLKHDLGPFLAERGAYGVSLLALYHRYLSFFSKSSIRPIMKRRFCMCTLTTRASKSYIY